MGSFATPTGPPASLESPPPSPPGNMSGMGWGAKPDEGLGPEANDPQIKALQGMKLIEMGAQQLATAIPELAGPTQAFVQQLMTLVPQMMSQGMTNTPGMPAPPQGP